MDMSVCDGARPQAGSVHRLHSQQMHWPRTPVRDTPCATPMCLQPPPHTQQQVPKNRKQACSNQACMHTATGNVP